MVMISGVAEALEICSVGRKEMDRERRRNKLTATCGLSDKKQRNYVVSANRITWSSDVVEVENHIPFLPPQVLYCNLESRLCQVLFSINSALKI